MRTPRYPFKAQPAMHHNGVPLDIIYEIRGRLPLKSLVRFRCISKAWIDITNDHYLARKHLQRLSGRKIRDPQLVCLINFHGQEGRTVTSKISKQGKMEINVPILKSGFVASCCNGWHCFGSYYRSNYDGPILMHNPLRQETLELPQISGFTTEGAGHAWYGLGFDASNNLFKLTCLFIAHSSTAEFYILRQKHFWEQLELPSRLRKCCNLVPRNVFLNGAIHYAVQDGNDIFTILAFDVEKEQFRCITLPWRRYSGHHSLTELGGLLAVYSPHACGLDVLKNYAKGEWDAPLRLPDLDSRTRIVEGSMDMDIVNDGRATGTQLVSSFKIMDTLHSITDRYLVYLVYDIQTGRFIDIVSSQLLSCSPHCIDVYEHELSLVPLNI